MKKTVSMTRLKDGAKLLPIQETYLMIEVQTSSNKEEEEVS